MLILYPTKVKSVKIAAFKVNLNPYMNKERFENRLRTLTEIQAKFRKTIYIKHKYKCAACGESLISPEQVDLHHIVPRNEGGKFTKANIVPLHKTCHESVSYAKKKWFGKDLNKSTEIKPRRKSLKKA
jgi:5-methylcytosine-specific restriction endonuclease McrA